MALIKRRFVDKSEDSLKKDDSSSQLEFDVQPESFESPGVSSNEDEGFQKTEQTETVENNSFASETEGDSVNSEGENSENIQAEGSEVAPVKVVVRPRRRVVSSKTENPAFRPENERSYTERPQRQYNRQSYKDRIAARNAITIGML